MANVSSTLGTRLTLVTLVPPSSRLLSGQAAHPCPGAGGCRCTCHLHIGGMVLFEVTRTTGNGKCCRPSLRSRWGQSPCECPHFPQGTQMSSHRWGPNSGQPSVPWSRIPCHPHPLPGYTLHLAGGVLLWGRAQRHAYPVTQMPPHRWGPILGPPACWTRVR